MEGIQVIVVGDIEGKIHKMKPLVEFIRANPHLQFVFLGDLFDDISEKARKVCDQLECVRLLSEFLPDDVGFTGPDSFKNITITTGVFQTDKRVQLISGNNENDVLCDLMKFESKVDDLYYFQEPKFGKAFNEEDLRLLYRYYGNMHSELIYEMPSAEKVIRFRHAWCKSFGFANEKADNYDNLPLRKDGNVLVVAGHNHNVGVVNTPSGLPCLLQIDTSGNDDDHRLAIVGFHDGEFYTRLMMGWHVPVRKRSLESLKPIWEPARIKG
jgi:hypothetical protein